MRAHLAWLIAVGCSGGPGSLPDAPSDDASDAAEPTDHLVAVTVTEGGVPAAGATVYFQNPDSSLVRETTTDLAGIARAPVEAGGFVTVIEPRPGTIGEIVIRDRLSTFAGVKPGDQLHLDLGPPPSSTSVMFTVLVPEDPGAEGYELRTSCGRVALSNQAPTAPVSVTLTGCGGVADMLVVTTDTSGLPVRAIYRPGQPVSNGAAVTFTEPYVDAAQVDLTITGSPAWVGNYVVEVAVTSARGVLISGFAAIDPTAPAATIAVPVAAATTRTLRTDVYPTQPAVARQTIVAWGLLPGDHAIDAGTAALRLITSLPTFDPATRTVTWTDEPGQDPDLVRTELYTYRAGEPAHAWTWQVVAPYGDRPSLTLPALQGTAAAPFTTVAADSFTVVELETLAVDGGYDRVRPHALRRALDAVPPGAGGQLTYQRLDEQNLLVSPARSRAPATFTRATR